MLKESVSEITGVVYVEMGINKYIVVIDWDRKISIYIDDPDSFECTPSKILNGCGNSAHEGHADDLSTVAFCSPNILATGSIDGIIVLWNFETGYIKLTLKDPFLDLRSKEEKAIEKVIFLSKSNADYSDLGKNQWPRIALISSHADGFIRFWEIQTGGMLLEVNCQLLEDEGINTITIDGAATTLFVGGSKGHIAIYDVSEFNIDSKRDLKFACLNKNSWRAHVDSISSLSYVAESKVVISSSADSTIRVWTLEGVFIGAFGQDSTWILGDPSTFMPLPNDLLAEAHIAMERKIREKQQSENIKKNVIDTWLGIAVDMGETQITETSAEMNKRVAEMRARTVQILVIKKWQEYSERKRNSSNWEVPEELLTWKNKTSFFSLKNAILKKDKRPQTGKSNDHVYRMLTTHSLEEVPNLVGPHSGSGKQHIRIGDGRDAKAAARAIAESNRRSKKVVK